MVYSAEYEMSSNGVANSLLFIEESLEKYKLPKRELMEALLISEEVLILLEENAPADALINVSVKKHMGIPRIKIFVPGEALMLDEYAGTVSLDQLGDASENTIRSIMLRSYADSITHRHSRGINRVTITTGIPERVLTAYTISAIALAVVAGIMFRTIFPAEATTWMINNVLGPIETLFISALMCITAPAVFISIACSMFRFEGFSDIGKNGKSVVTSYAVTSVIAALIGLACFFIFQPGETGALAQDIVVGSPEGFSILAILTTLIPHNIVEPFISVNSLQLMVIAMVIGAALTMSGKKVSNIKVFFEEMDVLASKISAMIMQIVPIAVFCSVTNVILNFNGRLFISTGEMILTICVGFILMIVVYCGMLMVVGRLNPITFLSKYAQTMKNTFLKGSAVAAVPMNMRICRRKFGVPQNLCSFSIPLGSTINMDGNCVCLTIMSLFYANMCGMSLDMNEMIVLILLVLVLSLGAPIAPGTLILCLITLLAQLGISTSVISLTIGINFILEMVIAAVNAMGDVAVTLTVSKTEGTLNLDTYNKK